MKILWVTNVSTADGATALPIMAEQPYGGWLLTPSRLLAGHSGVELHLAAPSGSLKAGHVSGFHADIYFHAFSTTDPRALPRLIDGVAPDLVHIFGTEMAHSAYAAEACAASNTPYVVSIQGIATEIGRHYNDGLPASVVLGWMPGDVLRRSNLSTTARSFARQGAKELTVLKAAQAILGRTDFDRAFVAQLGLARRYHHVRESLRPAFYSDTWQLDQCRRNQLFLSQASYPVKGLHTLLEALPSIIARHPDLQLLVAGHNLLAAGRSLSRRLLPSYPTYLRAQISRLGLEQYVRFTGPLAEQDYKETLLVSHLAVCPSTTENSPNSLAEAMALGMPVTASHAGGIASIVSHGVTGLLHSPLSPVLVADAILQILDDDRLATRLGEAAQPAAREAFSPTANLGELLAAYAAVHEGVTE